MDKDPEVDKAQHFLLKSYLAVAKLALSIIVGFVEKKWTQKITNGTKSLVSKTKSGVQQFKQWNHARVTNKATKALTGKELATQSLSRNSSQHLGKLKQLYLNFALPLAKRLFFSNNTVTRDRGTRELGSAVKDTVAKPNRTEPLQINNTRDNVHLTTGKLQRSNSAPTLAEAPKKLRSLSEITSNARKISNSINKNTMKKTIPLTRSNAFPTNLGR